MMMFPTFWTLKSLRVVAQSLIEFTLLKAGASGFKQECDTTDETELDIDKMEGTDKQARRKY